MSQGHSVGTIRSPSVGGTAKYPPNVRCAYIFDGLQDRQHLERTTLRFAGNFDLPTKDIAYVYFGAIWICLIALYRCSTGARVIIFLHGQSKLDPHHPDLAVCSTTRPADNIQSSSPRMVVIFNTSDSTNPGRGFTAQFRFIPGSYLSYHPAMVLTTYLCMQISP